MRQIGSWLVMTCAVLPGCGGDLSSRPVGMTPDTASVWAVDLVQTLPGAQADYLASIRTNWANARRVATARGAVLSYRALVTPPDSSRGWDVLLMTEYADSAAWHDREEIFRAIFTSPDYVAIPPARPSEAMRTFAAGDVMMHPIVSVP